MINEPLDVDVCIIGAGPSGASASMMLTKLGVHHVIVDQATFPRDKTCGDGLILHVFKALKILSPNLLSEFLKHPKFISTNVGNFQVSDQITINIEADSQEGNNPIYFGKRIDFDFFLVEQLYSPFLQKRFGVPVHKIENSKNGVNVELKDNSLIKAKLVIGADGIHSIVSKKIGKNNFDLQRSGTFVNAYFENVGSDDLIAKNGAFVKMVYKKMPLFFYIFPLPNGQANISLGGTTADLKKNKVNLRKEVKDILENDPIISQSFTKSNQISDWRGWSIPYNYGNLTISGDRFMLVGDAAGLANPFYKEGVGTGMMSGILAAEQAKKCMDQNNFSSGFIKDYDQKVEAEFGKLLKYSKAAFKMSKYRLPFKTLVKLFKSKIENKINYLIQKMSP